MTVQNCTTVGKENRRAYRELFYTAKGMGQHISGAIMYKETLYQSAEDGRSFVECLHGEGMVPGIKVDEGLTPIEGCEAETCTRGLDNLAKNLPGWHAQGARFAKWRAALKVTEACPSERAVQLNAEQLAAYAGACQAHGLVPVVEPEILIDGDHSMQRFGEASTRVLAACVAKLWAQGVHLEACLLKPQMVLPGAGFAGPRPAPSEVAAATLTAMRRTVPAAIPGIMFLSGGQTEEEATNHLNHINRLAQQQGRTPWSLSFSFGRALQASVLRIWSADRSRRDEAQRMALALAAANGAAARGAYEGPHPSILSDTASLHESFRGWSGAAGP